MTHGDGTWRSDREDSDATEMLLECNCKSTVSLNNHPENAWHSVFFSGFLQEKTVIYKEKGVDMADEPSHGADDFQLAALKNAITGSDSCSQSSQAEDGLQGQFSREDEAAKETQYVLLQLISMVRENSILYDEELQATIPESQLKREKREAWDRIRADILWQDMTPVQDVWSDLLEQYARKSEELPDNLLEALRWTDAHISKKKDTSDSRPPSQMNNMSSSLDKDFFSDVPLSEDVLVSGQRIGSPSSSLNLIRDYMVIQPSRRSGDLDVDHSRPSSSIQSSSTQYSRRKSKEPRETDAVVRSYPLSLKGAGLNLRVDQAKTGKRTHEVKKEYKDEGPQMNFGRPGVLVEVEHGYTTPSPKIYKIVSSRTTPPQATATVTAGRRLVGRIPMHRGTSYSYDVPPDSLIESPESSVEPPSKKKLLDELRHHRTSSIAGPSTSKIRVRDTTVSIISERANDKHLINREPEVEDEIILDDTETECKPMVGTELLLGRQSTRSTAQMASSSHDTSADEIHHYHHDDIEDGGVIEEDVEQPLVVVDPLMTPMQSIQYDEDLAFQQHINGVLNRLSDDEKAVMKFNMQKIILDARFGPGTARDVVLKDTDLLEVVQEHIDPADDPNRL